MKKYLSTIHTRSPEHKKRFALAVSGGLTSIIFIVWALVNFGVHDVTVADAPLNTDSKIIAPFDDIKSGVADTIQAVKNQANSVKQVIDSTNVGDQYDQLKNQALPNGN